MVRVLYHIRLVEKCNGGTWIKHKWNLNDPADLETACNWPSTSFKIECNSIAERLATLREVKRLKATGKYYRQLTLHLRKGYVLAEYVYNQR